MGRFEMIQLTLALLFCFFLPVVWTSPTPGSDGTWVSLRIEGDTSTIFENILFTRGHDVKAAGETLTHPCDGTNNHSNPTPGPTAGSALDDASKIGHFSWDGVWFPSFEDYLVTTIAGVPRVEDEDKYWHIILNYGYAPVGACQLRVKTLDEVLFGYSAQNKTLKLEGPQVARVDVPVTFTVTDGETNKPVSGAIVSGNKSNRDGHVSVKFSKKGVQSLKADKIGVIRSKRLDILIV